LLTHSGLCVSSISSALPNIMIMYFMGVGSFVRASPGWAASNP
jgi:hypothetical protein